MAFIRRRCGRAQNIWISERIVRIPFAVPSVVGVLGASRIERAGFLHGEAREEDEIDEREGLGRWWFKL
jgi:hypothetical protein